MEAERDFESEPQYRAQGLPKDPLFMRAAREGLVWIEHLGMGWYPVRATAQEAGYFEHYRKLAGTTMGQALTARRVQFVADNYTGPLVDVGVGCGAFVEARGGGTYGFDVTEEAIGWLREKGLWWSPHVTPVDAAAFWDSLEHIPEPRKIVDQVRRWLFVSMPIYRGLEHLLKSKHFKPQEHVWYWTRRGLVEWMRDAGFALRSHSTFESDLGREDIESFAFQRVG